MTEIKYCEEHGGIGPFEYNGYRYYVAPASTFTKTTWDDAQEYVKTFGKGWGLPSKDELYNVVCNNKTTIVANDTKTGTSLADMDGEWVWSSTGCTNNNAWIQCIPVGGIYGTSKYYEGWVVAVKRVKVTNIKRIITWLK